MVPLTDREQPRCLVHQTKLSRYSCCPRQASYITYMSHKFGTGRLYVRIQLTLLILQFYEIRTLNGQISSPPTCPQNVTDCWKQVLREACRAGLAGGPKPMTQRPLKWVKSGWCTLNFEKLEQVKVVCIGPDLKIIAWIGRHTCSSLLWKLYKQNKFTKNRRMRICKF